MLSWFDLINLIRDANLDDSFYSFRIVQHLSEGSFSTLDGIIRTNGYHPLWMLCSTPIYWISDSESVLFAIEVFEVMLVSIASCLLVPAARLARLSWVLLFAILPTFLANPSLYMGMEAAAGLFCLAISLLGLVLFARSPERWQWLLAIALFILPWIRLEYIAVSLVGTSTLRRAEWTWKKRDRSTCSISMLRSGFPLFSAVSSLPVYFAYNYLVFDGIIPVSGAVKTWRSQQVWGEMGGEYDLVQNSKSLVSLWPLWERIEPYFDYQFSSEPIGIIVDGRLVLSIARDRALAERDILLQYTTGDGETNTSTQRPWKTGEEGVTP